MGRPVIISQLTGGSIYYLPIGVIKYHKYIKESRVRMESKINIMVSQLTVYEKRRLNNNRICELCGKEIRDFQPISYLKLRDRRKVFYKFCHHECYKANNNSFEKE